MPPDGEALLDPSTGPLASGLWNAFNLMRDEISNALIKEATYIEKINYLQDQLELYKTARDHEKTQNEISKKALESLKEHSQKERTEFENKIKLWQGYRIVTLLDGDGAIFSPDFITRGRAGGREAAKLLSDGILQYVTANYGSNQYQLFVYLFVNKRGLTNKLEQVGQLKVKHCFENFLVGLNEAAERFLVVDVGSERDAADAKIRTHFDDAVRLPQTFKIVFGGCHDGGYIASIRSHITAGYKEKLLLLKSYSGSMATSIARLDAPVFDIPDLFIPQKLPTPDPTELDKIHSQAAVIPAGYSSVVKDHQRRGSTGPSNNTGDEAKILNKQWISSPSRGQRKIIPGLALSKHQPPPCNMHYLSKCKFGADCTFAHDYSLNEELLAQLRSKVKEEVPCPALNKGKICYQGDACCYGHYCNMLLDCPFYKSKTKTCRFRGANMHKEMAKQ